MYVEIDPHTSCMGMCPLMIGKTSSVELKGSGTTVRGEPAINLVADEPVEFEKQPVEVHQDFRRITYRSFQMDLWNIPQMDENQQRKMYVNM